MFLIAAVLVLSLVSFGVIAVYTAPTEQRSHIALRIVDVLAALINPLVIWHLVNNRGHPKKCKRKPANRKFDSRD